jgi:hypothetical protein
MQRLTTASLALISLIALAIFPSSCAKRSYSGTHPTPLHIERASRYLVQIDAPKARMTGILLLKPSGQKWEGRMINEFGISIFDLISTPNKCKLHNVFPMINKWYIRMTIEHDLAYLLWKGNNGIAAKDKQIETLPNGGFILTNTKHNIKYTFNPTQK